MKPLFPTLDNPVLAMKEKSRLNSVLMLGDCVSERLTLEVAVRYGYYILVLGQIFCCKVLLQYDLKEKWQLR